MLSEARRRARKFNIPCSITAGDIVVPTHCPVFGTELSRTPGRTGPNTFSLDRIYPALGYVPGNILVMSQRANTLKNNASPQDLAAILENVFGWKCIPPAEA
jgi:hypothetical protein